MNKDMTAEEVKAIIEQAYDNSDGLDTAVSCLLLEASALRTIEKNRWAVSPQCNGGWVIETASPIGNGDDADVIEIARTRSSLVKAVSIAIENTGLYDKPFSFDQ